MLFKEIETIFTQKVMEHIQRGYIFNCNTMAGHQGEVAKVDLRKGDEIIRVLMYEEYKRNAKMLLIIVGRNPKKINHARYETIWNANLEIMEEVRFFEIEDGFYADSEEEFKAIEEKRSRRWARKYHSSRAEMNEKAKAIVLPFVKRLKGFKSCKVSDIKKVEKVSINNRNLYQITVRGKIVTF